MLSFPARRRALAACLVSLTLLVPETITAQETLTIQPAGVVTWSEMVQFEARAPARPKPRVIPFMPGPPPREIGAPPGSPLAPAEAVTPPAGEPRVRVGVRLA